MALIIPTCGENRLLGILLGASAQEDFTLKLFVNDIVPADEDTATTYTEMSTLGYSAKTLAKAGWTVAQIALSGNNVAEGIAPVQTWTFTAGVAVDVYGYFVVGATSGELLWTERFALKKTAQTAGDTIQITPKFTLSKA